MLRRLQIRDYVIVDSLELDFEAGFGALTGETGAGKSILVDALGLVLGDRADAAVVRAGRERADIVAEFSVDAGGSAAEWLRAHELADEEGGCLLRRVVDAAGRSKAYINGAAATAAQLRELGERLADIHGQHAHHALLRAEAQRALLDAFGALEGRAREVAQRHREWSERRRARERAEASAAGLAAEREALAWQLEELRELAFDPDDWDEVCREQRRLANAAELIGGADEVLGIVDEGEVSLVQMIERASARLAALAEYDTGLSEARALLESAGAEIGEAGRALRRYRDRLDLDPDRLRELDQRIEAVTRVARKHRAAPGELPALRLDLEARVRALAESSDPALLRERESEAQSAYLAAAHELSAGRRAAAARLSQGVDTAMADLAMAGGRFEIGLEPLAEPGAHGLESVEFRVSTHGSQPLRPLARVASGGELSRIGLAIQVMTSWAGGAPTLLFDEVDVGIGGAVAEIVGRMLRRLGGSRQVLCVTHLPQVAAQAHWQWSVAKDARDSGVVSRVRVLDAPQRIEEIARMLGGVRITEATRRHAAEMLEAAAAARTAA